MAETGCLPDPDRFLLMIAPDMGTTEANDFFGVFLPADSEAKPCPTVAGALLPVETGRRHVNLPAGQLDLPRLGLWFDVVHVESFLAGTDVAGSPSDLFLTLDPRSPPMTLPILNQRRIKWGDRDIDAFQVLLPLALPALTAWQRAVADNDAALPPTIVMDVSGSAANDLDRFMTDLLRPLVWSEAGLANVVVVTTTDGQTFSRPQDSKLADLAMAGHQARDDYEGGYDLAALLPDRQVILLYGGDLAIPSILATADHNRLHVVQITPELDSELTDSAASFGLTARIRTYDSRNAADLAALLLAEPGFKSARVRDDDIYAALADGQIAAGFPVIVPQTAAAETTLGDVVTAGRSWQAVPVWLIRNDLLMTVVVADVP